MDMTQRGEKDYKIDRPLTESLLMIYNIIMDGQEPDQDEYFKNHKQRQKRKKKKEKEMRQKEGTEEVMKS